MSDLQKRKTELERIYESYKFFEDNSRASGDLMSRVNQFVDNYAEAEPYRMYIYQKALRES